MIEYFFPSRLFKKKWVWFANPHDVSGVDTVNFFSYDDVEAPGFKKKEGWTSVIDLNRDLEEVWEGMRKDFIRLQIEKGERKGITVKQDNNFAEFKPILEEFRKSKGLGRENYEVLSKYGLLFSAYLDGRMIAGGIFMADKNYLRVWMLASKRLDKSEKGIKQVIGQANRMILWEAIKYAKAKGMKMFDFCGLDVDATEGPLHSVAVYKEAFGGRRIKNYYYSKTYSRILLWLQAVKSRIGR